MILMALNDYYHRLAGQLDSSGQAKVPPYGFSDEKISYVLILSKDGQLVDVQSLLSSDKKPLPKLLPVPQAVKRTSGAKPNFLWDKTAYVLGVEGNKDKQAAKTQPWLAAEKTFDVFKNHHLQALKDSSDTGLKALHFFLQSWKPEQFDQSACNAAIVDSNVIFRLDGAKAYLHESPEAIAIWSRILEPADDSVSGGCLVTGEQSTLARLHPPIKGVYGGQSSGGSIVSFNAESYTSFGKEQGENAPVSDAAAFAYTAALNYLLRRDNRQCISVGDASTVFWAQAPDQQQEQQAQDLFGIMMNMPVTDDAQAAQIKPVMEQIAKGKPLTEVAPNIDAATRFYILGIAPNASRLSIRYWLSSSFGELAENLAWHWRDLAIEPIPWREPPSVWRLLIQTAAQGKSENIPPQLAGELLRAIITGQPYPHMLLAQLVQRIRSDGDVNGLRVAMIRAVLQRKYRKGQYLEELPMGLDENSELPGYRLGRLFAVLERIQSTALGSDLNAGIADRYYGTASAVPYSVFPRLIASSQNHLSKIRKDKPGYAINLKKDLASVMEGLDAQFPKHFSIDQQGQFALGYYHQKQKYFAKKSTEAETTESETQGE
jgi:CRISPR-associated protein Csd1